MPAGKTTTHLSHSQVSEFLICPRRYHLHRRLGLPPEFRPSPLLFGICMHEALARYHQKRLEGRRAGASELLDVFTGRWQAEKLPVKLKEDESAASIRKEAEGLLAVYLEEFEAAGEVLAVEEPFRLTLDGSFPEVWGRIDLAESLEDRLVLTDFKTASSAREPDPGQLVLYRRALRALGYAEEGPVVCRYVSLVRTKTPKVCVFEPEIGPEDLKRLTALYGAAWRDIRSGCRFPRPGWPCEGCQWRSACDQA